MHTLQPFIDTKVATITADETAEDAILKMETNNLHHLVVFSNGHVLGIISNCKLRLALTIEDSNAR